MSEQQALKSAALHGESDARAGTQSCSRQYQTISEQLAYQHAFGNAVLTNELKKEPKLVALAAVLFLIWSGLIATVAHGLWPFWLSLIESPRSAMWVASVTGFLLSNLFGMWCLWAVLIRVAGWVVRGYDRKRSR